MLAQSSPDALSLSPSRRRWYRWLNWLRITKLYKWEYWPFWFFYIPLYFYWLWLGLKARSIVFFSAANPLMELGGFSAYSKYNVLRRIPIDHRPTTRLIQDESQRANVAAIMAMAGLSFPIVAKPDRGERGRGVARIHSLGEMQGYFAQEHQSIILQELIAYPLELGVMYYRMPNEETGHISSVVQKEFLTVIGDGQSTIGELVQKHERYVLFYKHLKNKYPERMAEILPAGQAQIIEPIGNHSRGTIFRDARHRITPELIQVFDRISQQIDGFFFGRYDLRAESWENLYAGKNFKIMELNGANSEPAHIYDPDMPIWKAYRDLFAHWRVLYKISVQNRARGIHYSKSSLALRRVWRHLRTGD
ncbi:MAG: D-alanine--D-alanine ligase [Microscillaceae bacterium]|nr:D-alanine--D-alanine ligase [Microscillaceae bacterium]